jgi:hypothetical protein
MAIGIVVAEGRAGSRHRIPGGRVRVAHGREELIVVRGIHVPACPFRRG